MFYNFQIYDSDLIFQEIRKYNFKIYSIPKSIKKRVLLLSNEKSDNKQGLSLVFIERVLFLNNSLNNLVKNLRENFFHYLN